MRATLLIALATGVVGVGAYILANQAQPQGITPKSEANQLEQIKLQVAQAQAALEAKKKQEAATAAIQLDPKMTTDDINAVKTALGMERDPTNLGFYAKAIQPDYPVSASYLLAKKTFLEKNTPKIGGFAEDTVAALQHEINVANIAPSWSISDSILPVGNSAAALESAVARSKIFKVLENLHEPGFEGWESGLPKWAPFGASDSEGRRQVEADTRSFTNKEFSYGGTAQYSVLRQLRLPVNVQTKTDGRWIDNEGDFRAICLYRIDGGQGCNSADYSSALNKFIKGVGDVAVEAIHIVATVIKFVAPFLTLIPGIGQGVAVVVGMAAGLALGEDISDACIDGIAAGLGPVAGPLAQHAFETAAHAVKAIVFEGKRWDDVGLEIIRANLPGGENARAAFDAGVGIAHGQSLQQVGFKAINCWIPGDLNQRTAIFLEAVVEAGVSNKPIKDVLYEQVKTQVIGPLSDELKQQILPTAQRIIDNPHMAEWHFPEIANSLHVDPAVAQAALAALRKVGEGLAISQSAIDKLSPTGDGQDLGPWKAQKLALAAFKARRKEDEARFAYMTNTVKQAETEVWNPFATAPKPIPQPPPPLPPLPPLITKQETEEAQRKENAEFWKNHYLRMLLSARLNPKVS